MTHILVTTDFSPASKSAFELARKQAELHGKESTKITLLSVLEDLAPSSIQFEFGLAVLDTQAILEEAHEQATKSIKELGQREFPGFQIETEVIRAVRPVHDEIIAFADENAADFIVIATHGRTGVRRFVLGSVSERVIREAPCPVIVVPAPDVIES